MYRSKNVRLLVAILLCFNRVSAQDSLNYDALTLTDLLNMKVGVASIKELNANEAPGIVTIIDGDEIRSSGARDLMEVLETVPGFEFGVDVQGVVGLGVRGNWAHEGKVLLMIDDQVMNEGLYSTIQLGNHYPLNSIKRIEIVRGPGSVVYGDYAEYAVINIVTESAAEINGVQATADYGTLKESYARRGGSFSAGKSFRDLSFDIKASHLEGNRSDEIYKDVYGNSEDLTGLSKLDNTFVNVGLSFKSFSFRAIADLYSTTTIDEYEEIGTEAVTQNFDSYFMELSHNLNPAKKFSVITKLNYKQQSPWRIEESMSESYELYTTTNKRYTANSTAQWDPTNSLNITFGGESFFDNSINEDTIVKFNSTGTNTLDYYNYAFFAQVLWKNKIATFAAGARQNYNSKFSSNLVPRFGITRAIGRLNLKALYSLSYRTPGAQNIDLGENISPEITKVTEFELGFKFSRNLYMVVNAFDMETSDPIIYYYDPILDEEGYINKERTGTQGIEAELKFISRAIKINAGYSYYTAENKPALENYEVPENEKALLGLANDKAFLTISSPSNKKIQASVQLIGKGIRYAIDSLDGDNPVYRTYDPSVKINCSLSFNNLFVKGINLSLGVYNVLDEADIYIQPYNSLHAPLPGRGREYRVQLSYRLGKSDN
jgi:outer membrane cobalamin receptor